MSKQYNSLPITRVAATITGVAGIGAPMHAEPSVKMICSYAESVFAGKHASRVFMYHPDAVALWLYQKYTAMFEKAVLQSNMQLPMRSVMPTVTPVCFASMYTGAMPDVHGINAYIKPTVKTDSVFDAYIRAGLKPVIVSTTGASLSRIFLEREMDYFIFDSHEDCTRKAVELITKDEHDLIVLYNGNYDTVMHRTGPESEEALNELRYNIDTYSMLIKQIEKSWHGHRTMIGFCPDHGCHEIDGNCGGHGLDMAEDMDIVHFYRFV